MKLRHLALSFFLVAGAQAADLVFAVGEWPPFVGESEIDYGTSSKQVMDICAKAGLKCDIEFMPWKRAYTLTQKGVADGTYPWTYVQEREEAFHISPELFQGKSVIFYTGDALAEGANKDYAKLEGRKIVGINSYTDAEKIKKSGMKIHMVNDAKLAWKMMGAGKADTFIDDAEVGMAECKLHAPEVCNKIKLSEPIRTSSMRVLFSRVGNNGDKIKQFIEAMK